MFPFTVLPVLHTREFYFFFVSSFHQDNRNNDDCDDFASSSRREVCKKRANVLKTLNNGDDEIFVFQDARSTYDIIQASEGI